MPMSGTNTHWHTRRTPSTIGALTRKDRRRESALVKKIDVAYGGMAKATSKHKRQRHLRAAHRHERALDAQRRRPQSLLSALAFVLGVVFAVVVVTRSSFAIAIAVGVVLAVDIAVLRRRRRGAHPS
jgi:Flp pilus assembly protein TadB